MSFEAVAKAYPWPSEPPYPTPQRFTLDGGGRDIVCQVLWSIKNPVLLEVGAFLGGSAKLWLDADPTARVVCVDPWEGEWWAPYAEKHGRTELAKRFREPGGPLGVFQTNMWDYRDRLVAVPAAAPYALHLLSALGLKPDVVYFDSDKRAGGMFDAATLWPDAVICGDDWNWQESPGAPYPMREPVRRLAKQTRRKIAGKRETWVLQKRPLDVFQRLDGLEITARDVARYLRK